MVQIDNAVDLISLTALVAHLLRGPPVAVAEANAAAALRAAAPPLAVLYAPGGGASHGGLGDRAEAGARLAFGRCVANVGGYSLVVSQEGGILLWYSVTPLAELHISAISTTELSKRQLHNHRRAALKQSSSSSSSSPPLSPLPTSPQTSLTDIIGAAADHDAGQLQQLRARDDYIRRSNRCGAIKQGSGDMLYVAPVPCRIGDKHVADVVSTVLFALDVMSTAVHAVLEWTLALPLRDAQTDFIASRVLWCLGTPVQTFNDATKNAAALLLNEPPADLDWLRRLAEKIQLVAGCNKPCRMVMDAMSGRGLRRASDASLINVPLHVQTAAGLEPWMRYLHAMPAGALNDVLTAGAALVAAGLSAKSVITGRTTIRLLCHRAVDVALGKEDNPAVAGDDDGADDEVDDDYYPGADASSIRLDADADAATVADRSTVAERQAMRAHVVRAATRAAAAISDAVWDIDWLT